MIRVLLADDHSIVRGGLARIVEESGDIEVVAEAADGREAIQQVHKARPDVAVVDNGQGFDAKDIAASEGLGLAGMRERASLLGGSLEIRSRPGKGTRVCFRLPVPADGG